MTGNLMLLVVEGPIGVGGFVASGVLFVAGVHLWFSMSVVTAGGLVVSC